VVLDEVLVDEAAEQRALVPTNDQMVDVQVTKVLQVVRYQIRANLCQLKRIKASLNPFKKLIFTFVKVSVGSFNVVNIRQAKAVGHFDAFRSVGSFLYLDHTSQNTLSGLGAASCLLALLQNLQQDQGVYLDVVDLALGNGGSCGSWRGHIADYRGRSA